MDDPDPFAFVRLLQPGSQIIVLTDAPAKPGLTAQAIATLAEIQQICIHFFLGESSYNCFADSPGSIDEYRTIADRTSGTVVTDGFEFSSFVQSYDATPCSHLQTATSGRRRRGKRNVVEQANCHIFRVSVLARQLKLSAMIDEESVTVVQPDGTEVQVRVVDPLVPGSRVAMFSEARPLPGEWAVCVEKGRVTVTTDVGVSLDVTPFYLARGESAEMVPTATPPPGCKLICGHLITTMSCLNHCSDCFRHRDDHCFSV